MVTKTNKAAKTKKIDFDDKYTGNTELKSECFDNDGRFETYGKDLKTVEKHMKKHGEEHIWTFVEGDKGVYMVAGFRFVNRIYYFISEEKWESRDEEYKIGKN